MYLNHLFWSNYNNQIVYTHTEDSIVVIHVSPSFYERWESSRVYPEIVLFITVYFRMFT